MWNFSAISESGEVYERPASLAISSSFAGIAFEEWAGDVLAEDRAELQDRRRMVARERIPRVGVQLSRDRQPVAP